MKAVPLAFRGVLLGLVTSSLHAQGPILSTPGTATWATENLASGGTRTIFTITGNTVLDWNQLNLGNGSELVFDFVSGESVVNNLTGSRPHRIDGTVSSNGLVGFFSPNAHLQVNGNITAKGVTIATLDVNPADFAGGNYALSGGFGKRLLVGGEVTATEGDVVLAGRSVTIGTDARITATGSALFAGGDDATVVSGGERQLNVVGTIGVFNHSGTTMASRVEVAAGESIVNNGRLDAGTSKIYLEVGQDGSISNELNGVIVGDAAFEGAFLDEGLIIAPYEGDILPVVNDSRLKVPTLKRPDGSKVTTSKKLTYSAPMSASSDAGRSAKRRSQQVAKVDSSKSLLNRSSFFGMRGSKTIASR
ncbi:hypothetical protein [Haloferula sp.]|uniref:hypothetical protein n=1 Tax=Haloferula sp. TaxID=2497595 RepID=UPI003C72CBDA